MHTSRSFACMFAEKEHNNYNNYNNYNNNNYNIIIIMTSIFQEVNTYNVNASL